MDQKEIEQVLQGLPKNDVLPFAARAALRLLPLLVTKNREGQVGLWCWGPEVRAQNMLALFRACNIGYLPGVDDLYIEAVTRSDVARNFARASDAVRKGAYSIPTYTDSDDNIARVVCYAACDVGDAFADSSRAAARAASRLLRIIPTAEAEFASDLNVISNEKEGNIIEKKLWIRTLPDNLQPFKSTILNLNAGFEFWLDWYEARLKGEPLDLVWQRQSRQIPPAIEEQGVAAINAYLQSLQKRIATAPLNRVRAIFIGYGDAGKTSLVRVLHGEPVAEKEPMTPGIDIREWDVPGTDIKAHFWDFGGQVMAHATHQLFLRDSCLYVLVLSARSEINATEQAEYWLEHVKSFGKGAPVLIVGNKADQIGLNLNMAALTQKYPHIVDFFPLSCTQATGTHAPQFAVFRQAFEQQLQKVGTHQMLFSEPQFAVLQALRELTAKTSFIKHEEFNALCDQHKVQTGGIQNRPWLLDVLDKLGVIVHFPQLKFLDEYVLNPRWLTYGVYTLMYSQRARLSHDDVIAILGREQVEDEIGQALAYPPKRCQLVMDAMREFKLCYSLPNEPNTLIIPALLPPGAPPYQFDESKALAFAFEFTSFLPRHVLPELIVNRHPEIVQQIVWQHGVLLQHKRLEAQALLQVDYHLRKLAIWVNGADARDYLLLLREEIHIILNRLDIDYKETLALPEAARMDGNNGRAGGKVERAPYLQILAHDRRNATEYISESGTRYDVRKVLLGYVSEKNLENERKQYVIINNSRLGNFTMADSIEGSFNHQQADVDNSVTVQKPVAEPGFWAELARVFKKYWPFNKK